MKVEIRSHVDDYEEAFARALGATLEALGAKCAAYAAAAAPHDTGRLRNSITWVTRETEGRLHSYADDDGKRFDDKIGTGCPENAVAVGTNVEYGKYQELGTERMRAQPYLRPAVVNHTDVYRKLVEECLRNAI